MLDGFTIRLLDEVIRDAEVQPQETKTLLGRMAAALHPLAGIAARGSPGWEVKRKIKGTTKQLAEMIDDLIDQANAVLIELNNLYVNLDDVRKIALEELGNPSSYTVVEDLWVFIMRKLDLEGDSKGYRKLLGDITRFHDVANGMVRDIKSSLVRAKAEMGLFSNVRFNANDLLEEYPAHVIAATLRKSIERLEASTQKFEGRGTRIAEVIVEKKKEAS